MTTTPELFMETISLNDDAVAGSNKRSPRPNNNHAQKESVDLEAQKLKTVDPMGMSETETETEDDQDVVVIVDAPQAPAKSVPTALPPLRVASTTPAVGRRHYEDPVKDYVDPSLFSPEISRHSMEVAQRRAKALEMELKELAASESDWRTPSAGSIQKLTAGEAIGIISSAFISSFGRVKETVLARTGRREQEYDLLSSHGSGLSPSSTIEELDGDGLQLSPEPANGLGKHFQSSIKPALKRISAYSNVDTALTKTTNKPRDSQLKRRIQWDQKILEEHADEEDDDDDDDEEDAAGETEALMINGSDSGSVSTPRNQLRRKKKRMRKMKGMMRRLTPKEKEELYKERPDLMIVPNWAQKYREEMMESESTRWSVWLIVIIGTLAALLIVLIILIAREKAAAASGR